MTTRELIEAHLDLVRHVVFQVAVRFPRHVDREELAAAGALGLVEAAGRYDESLGVPFNRFAAQRIRGAILDNVRAADWAPRSVRVWARRITAAEQVLANTLGWAPTPAEVAAELDVTVAELARLQERVFRSVVLALEYTETDLEEDLTLVDVLADEMIVDPAEELADVELRTLVNDAVALLPVRHRTVIVAVYANGATQTSMAGPAGVTVSRISQIHSEALVMLRDGIEAQLIARPVQRGRAGRRKDRYATAIRDARPWQDRLAI